MSTTKNPTRRTILAGATALPAVAALPVIADAAANPDAELVALGARLEPLFLEYASNNYEWARRAMAANAEVGNFPDNWLEMTKAQQDAHISSSCEAHERHGANAYQDRITKLHEDIEPIAERIVDATATSLGGLRAKALALLWEARPSSADSTTFDFRDDDDGGAARSLFEAAANLTGLMPVVRMLEARLAGDAGALKVLKRKRAAWQPEDWCNLM